jgi:hypothetical protein
MSRIQKAEEDVLVACVTIQEKLRAESVGRGACWHREKISPSVLHHIVASNSWGPKKFFL